MESDTAFSLISSRVNEIIKNSTEIIDENNTKAVNPRSIQKGIVSHGRLSPKIPYSNWFDRTSILSYLSSGLDICRSW